MNEEDKIVKEFAEWARTTQAGYGEDEADIWFEDIPAYDALEWKVREIVRSLLTSHSKAIRERVEGLGKPLPDFNESGVSYRPCDYASAKSYNEALNDILALLTDEV